VSGFDYKTVAARMREQNSPPYEHMPINDYYAANAIYALIRALESMGDSK
jgi:hypothetical protein